MASTNFEFTFGSGRGPQPGRRDEEAPMRLLVLGDFGGRSAGAAGGDDYSQRRPLAVDIDNFDQVMRKVAPRCTTRAGETIAFGELDDFHPDTLYCKLGAFERLRDLRQRLRDTSTFAEAADALRAELQLDAPVPEGAAPPAATPENYGDTLSRLLGGSGGAAPASTTQATPSGLDSFIRGIVAGHVTPDAPTHQAQYVAAAESALALRMNSIVHEPAFQSVEASWRGLYWLVANLELGERLKLFVLDVTKAELLEDVVRAGNDLARSTSYKTLVENPSVAGAEPWSLIVGAYQFDAGGEDVALLATLGAIAAQAGAAFVGGAAPALAGAQAFVTGDASEWGESNGASYEAWQALRHSAMASHIGLAAPRMLLRLPYGKATDPTSGFDFDELGSARAHDGYLWGSGAFACALLIGRAFTARGWDMEPGDELDVDDLPAHAYTEDGEKRMQACAETYLSERAGQALVERGLIPLLSYAGRNAIRVMRFQSIAEPPQPLRGPW